MIAAPIPTTHAAKKKSKGTKQAPIKKSPWVFGPSITFGFPHPLNLEVAGTMSRFGFGIGYGTLSYKIVPAANPEPIRVGLTNFDFKGRWFPFAGSFFLGGSVGREILYATTHRTFTIPDVPVLGSVSTAATMTVDYSRWNFIPHFGWFGTFKVGLTLGFEVGAEIPFGGKVDVNIQVDDENLQALVDAVKETDTYKDSIQSAEDSINQYGNLVIPYVTLFRIGWMF